MSDENIKIKVPRRRRRRAGLLVLLSVAVIAVGLPLLVLSVTGMSLSAPDWVTRRVEDRINDNLGAGRVSLGRLQFTVDGRGIPRVLMSNVGVFDPRGSEIARLNNVSARMAPERLLQGGLALKALRLSGAQITVRRRADGTFDLSLGAGAGTSGSLAAVLDGLDRAFAVEPLSELDRIFADQLTITLEDSRSGRIWQVTDGRLTLDQSRDSLDLTIAADVFNGTEELASTVIGFRTEKGSPQASLTATFENAAAADIAAQSPALAFLAVLEAPISGALRASIDAAGVIEGLAGTLEVGAGALQPVPGTPPIAFDSARAYVAYDPRAQTLAFSQVSLQSDAARVTAEGTAYLQDFTAGWPASLVGQFALSDAVLRPAEIFAEPMRFARGAVDFRLRLDPFSVEIGQVALQNGDQRFSGKGSVRADNTGWGVALDLALNEIPLDRLLALWPVSVAPGTRTWLGRNILSGNISDLSGAFRLFPGQAPQISMNYGFSGAEVKFMRSLPPVVDGSGYGSLVNKTYTTVIEAGRIVAPNGGAIDMAGTVVSIADVTRRPGRAEIALQTDSSINAGLSLLDLPPFQLMTKAGLGTDLAEGRALLRSDIGFDLTKVVDVKDVAYSVEGVLRDMTSDKLVRNRTISAAELALRASRAGISIGGPGKLGAVPFNVTWAQDFGPDTAGKSHLEGTVELGQALLDEFGIGLPAGTVTGTGVAQIAVDLEKGKPPVFSLLSDLNRVRLSLAALQWSKPRNRIGKLEIAGRLGKTPAIDRLVLDAAGLRASGVVDLTPGGALDVAQFDRVRLGGWLDGPVVLTGRGPNLTPAVAMRSGTIDLRRAALGSQDGGRGGGGPLSLTLDRLVISEGIALTDFIGQFTNKSGLSGSFSARVNGRTPIDGTLVPTPSGSAVRLRSDDAGGTIAAAGILNNARGGRLDLTLNPTGADGVYDGRLSVSRTRIVKAPALTDLLSALSIVGLLDQMNSGGITLSEVEAEFRLTPNQLVLYRSSAVGPSIGVSLDGTYDLNRERLDMQGVISPVYFLNGIGQIFSRRGEGVFGFNFRLTGTADDPGVSVNPLSILTPGMFREIFRRPPPQPAPGQ